MVSGLGGATILLIFRHAIIGLFDSSFYSLWMFLFVFSFIAGLLLFLNTSNAKIALRIFLLHYVVVQIIIGPILWIMLHNEIAIGGVIAIIVGFILIMSAPAYLALKTLRDIKD